MSDTQYRNLKLMQNVRMALREVEALKDRMNMINLLLSGSGWGSKYSGLNSVSTLLDVAKEELGDLDMEDFFIALETKLENLSKDIEEEMFTAQELRNLGREVDL